MRSCLRLLAIVLAFGTWPVLSVPAAGQSTPSGQKPAAKPTPKTAKPSGQAASRTAAPAKSAAWDQLVKEAADAREAGRLDEAIALYGKAVGQRADWTEGHWYLGVLDD